MCTSSESHLAPRLSPCLLACLLHDTRDILSELRLLVSRHSSWCLYKEQSQLLIRRYISWVFVKRSVLATHIKKDVILWVNEHYIYSPSKNHSFELKGTVKIILDSPPYFIREETIFWKIFLPANIFLLSHPYNKIKKCFCSSSHIKFASPF